MASTSGTVVTSPEQHQRSLTLTWSQTSQSIANNTTTISWTLKGSGSDSIYYYVTCRKIKVTINGTQAWYNAGEIDVNNQQTIATGTFDVPHNADGTKTLTIAVEASIYEVNINSSGSGSWTLATIPRYATVTQSLSSKTETSITMAWSSDSTCDYVWYKIGSGSWTGIAISAAKSGTYTITGRSANTAYTIYTRVRRKDSQLTTDSTGLSVTTYQYPYANSMPNFTIGNDVTIGIYNPLGRTVTLKMLAADDTTIATKTVTGTSVNGFNTSTMQTLLYNSIPSATSGTYKISCTYSSQTQTKTGGTYSVNASQCKPSIASATYVDANASTVAITGDSSKIVRTLSQVTFTGSSCAAQKGASVSSVSVSVNGLSYAMTLSGGAVKTATKTGVTINSGSNVTATITVTDSRGYTASASVTVKMVNWQLPTGIISLKRHDNYYSDVDLKCDASWTSIGSNTCTITYKCRIVGSGSWTVTGTLSDNVTVTITLDNQSAWEVWVILTDSFGGTTTYKLQLSRGMPIAFFDRLKSSVGINCFPQSGGSLELGGLLALGSGIQMPYTNDILADAMAMPTNGFVKFFRGSGASYTGSIPFANNAYGTFIVLRRGTYQLMVIAISQSVNNGISFNSCTDGETWLGWQTFVKTTRTDGALSGVHSLSAVPSETGGCFYPATLTASVTFGAVTIPAYTKGFYCCSGADAVFLGIDSSCNVYAAFRNGTTWRGERFLHTRTVNKSATISFAAGTIGTRGYQTSWTASAIGGNPIATQLISVTASNEYMPMAFIDGTTAYLNAYRATASAVSNRNVTVQITYVPS